MELPFKELIFFYLFIQAMVEELCNGACIAMEIVQDENVPTTFREFVGPADPVSWALQMNTL